MDARRHDVALAFGAMLRNARTRLGITQEELAERANVDRTYPSLLERGLRTPTLTAYFSICTALSLKPESLILETVCRLTPKSERQL